MKDEVSLEYENRIYMKRA